MRTKWLTIPIVGIEWTVYLTDEDDADLRDSNEHKSLEGRCLFWKNIILVNRRLPVSRLPDVLLHEVLHAVVFLSGARETCGLGESDDEEKIVVTLAGPLTAALAACGALKFPDLKPPVAKKEKR
jgi:hypothetical protein